LPRWVHSIYRIVPGVGVGLSGLLHQRVDGQELPRPRVVVTPN